MQLLFVRHGQPRWQEDGAAIVDPDLTSLGRRQALAAADRIRDMAVAEIIVSPARRSQQTAEPIIAAAGIEPTTIDDITEMKMPMEWADTPGEVVEQIFRDSRHRPPSEWWDGIPGGESFRDFHTRITTAMDGILLERAVSRSDEPHLWDVAADPGLVVIVAHAGTNAVALGHLRGLDPTPWEWERFNSPHASFATIRAVPLAGRHVFGMYGFGDTGHLAAGDVTY